MKEDSKKHKQVASMLQREFSAVLQDCGYTLYGTEAMVTVMRVRMSADLGIAYIYLSVYNVLYKQEVIKELWENLSFLRGELGKRIRKQVRAIPALKFFLDDTLDEVEHIDSLFAQLHSPANPTRSMKEAMEERAARQSPKLEEDEDEEEDDDDDWGEVEEDSDEDIEIEDDADKD